MKRSDSPSVTSLPQSPQDEARTRTRRYVITMSIRVLCFLLMVLVTPYGWYTWVFGISAAVLPYIAVVFANAVGGGASVGREEPAQELEARPSPVTEETPGVITVRETPRDTAS